MSQSSPAPLGARLLGRGLSEFCVWAPNATSIELHIVAPEERLISLDSGGKGYFHAVAEGVDAGTRYFFRIDGDRDRPDPASRFQPEGVHGPSEVAGREFPWNDGQWPGLPLEKYIIYEIHVGTFTEEGTFDAIMGHLDAIRELGITAIELMPVAQFPGERNWGYDGVQLFAVHAGYGGPEGLKRLVDACHAKGLAVVLDVVYNHLGPEGNYLGEFGPYFQTRYHTPWGPSLNFDGPCSDDVRRFFIENALHWVTEFHIDALRLDAVHAIMDLSPHPFLEELGDALHRRGEDLNRRICLFPESDQNDPRLVLPPERGGYGLDAVWTDDFHHSLHTLLTGERNGYYADFGSLENLAQAFRGGFVYIGQHSPFRKRRHGRDASEIPAFRHVICSQNHDQVGNRLGGERLAELVSFEELKLAAGLVVLSPFIPLMFMGEEYGETAPFLYFTSHSDRELIVAVRKGRREEFSGFAWQGTPPDPQDENTFRMCKLNHGLRREGKHQALRDLYKELISLRKKHPALSNLNKETLDVRADEKGRALMVHRWREGAEAVSLFRFGGLVASIDISLPRGEWKKILDSADKRWLGEGSEVPETISFGGCGTIQPRPASFVLYSRGGGNQMGSTDSHSRLR